MNVGEGETLPYSKMKLRHTEGMMKFVYHLATTIIINYFRKESQWMLKPVVRTLMRKKRKKV